jgi:hypothetical protein
MKNIKIEALVFTPSGLVMATDDENKGAKIAIKLIKKPLSFLIFANPK